MEADKILIVDDEADIALILKLQLEDAGYKTISARDGVEVQLFGQPAWIFRSPAIIARSTGAAVVPVTAWRDSDGRHVIRFAEALPFIECDDPDECIRQNSQVYVDALEGFILRHPEQWWWMHRRWKVAG